MDNMVYDQCSDSDGDDDDELLYGNTLGVELPKDT